MERTLGGSEQTAVRICYPLTDTDRSDRADHHCQSTKIPILKISRALFLAVHWVEKRYYRLSYWPRHVVGYLLILLILGGIAGIGYGGYRGAKAGWHLVQQIANGDWNPFGSKKAAEYNTRSWSHYDFPVPQNKRHPKRMPNYSKDFDYINDVHMRAAQKLGITPPKDRAALNTMKGKLVQLRDTRYYSILPLTSSSPYLVPRAADFLTALGKLMQEYNGTESRFYISSVLRTQADVKKLGHINSNASKNSTHCYGTTFDITYSRFDVHGKTTEGQLKIDLARALYDMQKQGYCYVKYEVRQPCFHVTVRP